MIDVLAFAKTASLSATVALTLQCPGARKTLDEYCDPKGILVLCLTTGPGVIIKREKPT